jgi:hypothetical protein
MDLFVDINQVLIGAIGDNGAMGSSLTEMDFVKKDGTELSFPELEENALYDGKSDDPFELIQNHPETLKQIKFYTHVDFETQLQLVGYGDRAVNGVEGPTLTPTTNYKSVRLITNAHDGKIWYIDIRKGNLTIRPTGKFTKKNELIFECIVSILSPRDASNDPVIPFEFYSAAASGRVATPTITQSGNDVSVACATDGATIYYTINGLDPLDADYGNEYSSAVTITGDVLFRAAASKSGSLDSYYAQKVCEYSD